MQTTTKAKETGKAEAALLWADKLTKTWDGEKYQFRDIDLVLLSLSLSLSLCLFLSTNVCMYVCISAMTLTFSRTLSMYACMHAIDLEICMCVYVCMCV